MHKLVFLGLSGLALIAGCAHPSDQQIWDESRELTIKEYEQAYQQHRMADAITRPECASKVPDVMMVHVRGGLKDGVAWIPEHSVPTFAEVPSVNPECLGR